MNWEAIGAIGEVVGAVGVIVTLGYLAAQIRQNSNVVRASTRQAISTTQVEIGLRIAENADLRAASARRNRGDPPPTPDAEFCDRMLRRAVLRAFENQYHQHKDGTFEDDMWAGYLETMKQSFAQPESREFWQEHQALYSSDFARFVERELLGRGEDRASA